MMLLFVDPAGKLGIVAMKGVYRRMDKTFGECNRTSLTNEGEGAQQQQQQQRTRRSNLPNIIIFSHILSYLQQVHRCVFVAFVYKEMEIAR